MEAFGQSLALFDQTVDTVDGILQSQSINLRGEGANQRQDQGRNHQYPIGTDKGAKLLKQLPKVHTCFFLL